MVLRSRRVTAAGARSNGAGWTRSGRKPARGPSRDLGSIPSSSTMALSSMGRIAGLHPAEQGSSPCGATDDPGSRGLVFPFPEREDFRSVLGLWVSQATWDDLCACGETRQTRQIQNLVPQGSVGSIPSRRTYGNGVWTSGVVKGDRLFWDTGITAIILGFQPSDRGSIPRCPSLSRLRMWRGLLSSS